MMMGSFLSRALIMVFGYAYPAYKCYKVVEKNNPEIDQLLFWVQYWILVAILTVCERVGDNWISWLPLYSEAKLAFFIYLWYPKTKGTVYFYDCFFRPFVAQHEAEIDRNLLELRVKGLDIAFLYWQKAVTCGQARFFEILQFVSAQSVSHQHSDQQEPNDKDGELKGSKEVDSHSFNASLSQQPEPSSELKIMPCLKNGNSNSSQQKTVSKESIHLTHSRWRLFQSAVNN